jgi:hypothetical protein
MTDNERSFSLEELLALEARRQQDEAAGCARPSPAGSAAAVLSEPVHQNASFATSTSEAPSLSEEQRWPPEEVSATELLAALASIKRASDAGGAPHPNWALALASVAAIEDELKQGFTSDMERVRARADDGCGALPFAQPGEAPCVTALRLVLGALHWWGRGVFDHVIVEALRSARDVLDARTAAYAPE